MSPLIGYGSHPAAPPQAQNCSQRWLGSRLRKRGRPRRSRRRRPPAPPRKRQMSRRSSPKRILRRDRTASRSPGRGNPSPQVRPHTQHPPLLRTLGLQTPQLQTPGPQTPLLPEPRPSEPARAGPSPGESPPPPPLQTLQALTAAAPLGGRKKRLLGERLASAGPHAPRGRSWGSRTRRTQLRTRRRSQRHLSTLAVTVSASRRLAALPAALQLSSRLGGSVCALRRPPKLHRLRSALQARLRSSCFGARDSESCWHRCCRKKLGRARSGCHALLQDNHAPSTKKPCLQLLQPRRRSARSSSLDRAAAACVQAGGAPSGIARRLPSTGWEAAPPRPPPPEAAPLVPCRLAEQLRPHRPVVPPRSPPSVSSSVRPCCALSDHAANCLIGGPLALALHGAPSPMALHPTMRSLPTTPVEAPPALAGAECRVDHPDCTVYAQRRAT